MIQRIFSRLLAIMLCLSITGIALPDYRHLAPPHRPSDEERAAVELLRLSLHKKVFSLPENQKASDRMLLREARVALKEISSPANLIGLFDAASLTVTRKTVHVLLHRKDGSQQAYGFSLAQDGTTIATPVEDAVYGASRFKHEIARVHDGLRQVLRLEGLKKEKAKATVLGRLKQRLLDLPSYLSEKALQAYRSLIGNLRPETMQKLEQWFNNNTAIRASKYILGGAGWAMPDGKRMTAAAHNAQLLRVLLELWHGDAGAFRKRHQEKIPDEEWPAYKKAMFDEGFKNDMNAVAASPEDLEMLMVAIALHDYGKLLRGSDHPTDSADIAAPLLQRLGYAPDGEKYRWIMALIRLHTQMGAGFLMGESTPAVILNAMSAAGIQDPEQRERFFRLLSLLTYADIGSVATGRFTREKLTQLRSVTGWLTHDPEKITEHWPRLRLLGLQGRPLFPDAPVIGDGIALQAHVEKESARPEVRAILQRLDERSEELQEFMGSMEFMYARFLFGPAENGSPAKVTPGNTVKFMTLANGLWQAMGKDIRKITFTDDTRGEALNTVLSDAGHTQILAMLAHRRQEIVHALRQGKSVRLWGMPVKLTGAAKDVLEFDTRRIRPHFDRLHSVEIGKTKLRFTPDMNEALRLQRHLQWLREAGYIGSMDTIRNAHYDELGLLNLQRAIPGTGRYMTLKFSNARLFDLDLPQNEQGMQDLMELLKEFRHMPEPQGLNPEALKKLAAQNAVSEQMRLFLYKRMDRYREMGWSYRVDLKSALHTGHPSFEPSPKVRKQILAAMHSVEGSTPKGQERINAAWITYEMQGLMEKGGLAEVCGAAPKVLHNRNGHNAFVLMPGWSAIFEDPKIKQLPNGHPDKPAYVLSAPGPDGQTLEIYRVLRDGMPVYLIKHDKFNPVGSYDVDGEQVIVKDSKDIYRTQLDTAYSRRHPDRIHPANAKTAIFFSKASLMALAALEEAKLIKRPDVLHTHDWQTGLVPALVRSSADFQSGKYRKLFKGTKLVHTIHNLGYKGLVNASPDSADDEERRLWESTGLPDSAYRAAQDMGLEFYGAMSLMKAGITDADAVTTVDEHYAEEVKTELFGQKFEGLFNVLKRFLGIPNGISRRAWNPREDKNLIARYEADPTPLDKRLGVSDLPDGKRVNKAWVKAKYGLDQRLGERVPLITFVGRMDQMKGLHLLLPAVEQMLKEGKAQFLFVGKGDERFMEAIRALMDRYPGNIARDGHIDRASDESVKQILAASDMGVIPSISEPFGLVSPQFLRFGAVPIANAVGGLQTTVKDFAQDTKEGNGYLLDLRRLSPDLSEGFLQDKPLLYQRLIKTLYAGMHRALDDYQDETAWNEKARQAQRLSEQYSWEGPADRYEELYRELLGHARTHGRGGLPESLEFSRAVEGWLLSPASRIKDLEAHYFQQAIQALVHRYLQSAGESDVSLNGLHAYLCRHFAAEIKSEKVSIFMYSPRGILWVRQGPYWASLGDVGARGGKAWHVQVGKAPPMVLGDVARKSMMKEMLPLLPLSLRVRYPVAEIPLDKIYAWLEESGASQKQIANVFDNENTKLIPEHMQQRLQHLRTADARRVLQTLRTARIVLSLIGGLKDTDDLVRKKCAAGLGRLERSLPMFPRAWKAAVLHAMAEGLRDEDSGVAEACANVLGRMHGVLSTLSAEEQGQWITRMTVLAGSRRAAAAKGSLHVLAAMAGVINRHDKKDRFYLALQHAAEEADISMKADIYRALQKIKSHAEEDDAGAWAWPDAGTTAGIVPLAVDAQAVAKAREVMRNAMTGLASQDWETREKAAGELGALGKKAAILGPEAAGEITRDLLRAARDEEARVRAAAALSLAGLVEAAANSTDLELLLSPMLSPGDGGSLLPGAASVVLKVLDLFLSERMDLEKLWRLHRGERKEILLMWLAAAQDCDVNVKLWLEAGENPARLLDIFRSEISHDPSVRAFQKTTRWSQLEAKLKRVLDMPVLQDLVFPHVTVTLSYLRDNVGGNAGFAGSGAQEMAVFDRMPALEEQLAAIFDGDFGRRDIRSAKRLLRSFAPPEEEIINFLRQLSVRIAEAARGKDHSFGLIDIVQAKFHRTQKAEDLDAMLAYRDYVEKGDNASPETISVFRKIRHVPTPQDKVAPEKRDEVLALLDLWINAYRFGADIQKDLTAAVRYYENRLHAVAGPGPSLAMSLPSDVPDTLDTLEALTKMRRDLWRGMQERPGFIFLEAIRLDNEIDNKFFFVMSRIHSMEDQEPFPLLEQIRMLRLLVENARWTGRPSSEFAGIEAELERLQQDAEAGTGKEWWLRFHSVMERIERQIVGVTQDSLDSYQRMVESLTDQIDPRDEKKRWIENYTIDRLKGESIYQLSLAVDRIGEKVRVEAGKSLWHAIVRGKAVGKIRVVSDMTELRSRPVKPDEIIVVPGLPLDAPPIGEAAGILVCEGTPLLGHSAYQARDRIRPMPFAATTSKKMRERLEGMDGRWVELSVEQGEVVLHRIPAPVLDAPATEPRAAGPAVVLGPADITGVKPIFAKSEYTIGQVGAKTMRLVEMENAAGLEAGVPPFFAVPFNVYERVLRDPQNAELAGRIRARIQKISAPEYRGNHSRDLEELREWIGALNIPDTVLRRMQVQMTQIFKGRPVFVRSSSNAEEIAGYAGTGLYDSYGGIVSRHELESAMLRVWASVWNERAFNDRKARSVDHAQVRMSLLIQEMAPVDYSFVINTVDPVRRDPDIAVMEMVQGYGEALVSGDPRFRGQPYRILYHRKTREITVDTLGDISERIVADENGRLVSEPADYLNDRLLRSPGDYDRLRDIFEKALGIEGFFKEPQEIEGTLRLQQGAWDVHVVQSRRQVIDAGAGTAFRPQSEGMNQSAEERRAVSLSL